MSHKTDKKNKHHEKKHEKQTNNQLEVDFDTTEELEIDDIQDADTQKWTDSLQQEIDKLAKDLAEMNQIATKAQHDYINLKMDFDSYQSRTESRQADQKIDTLTDVVKKFLPFVESLRKSLDTISEEMRDQPLATWVQMTYDNFLKTLESLGISQIQALGLEPDSLLHEPVNVQPVQDEAQKWKIIAEFERGFVYNKWDIKKVITTSKVVIWQ